MNTDHINDLAILLLNALAKISIQVFLWRLDESTFHGNLY